MPGNSSRPMRMCSSIARCRSSSDNAYHGRTFTNGYTTRYGEPLGTTLRARRALVYRDAFVVARYEYGVSSQPASGVPLSAAPSSPSASYWSQIFQRKKSVSGRMPVVVYARRWSNRSAKSSTASAKASLPAWRSSTGSRRHAGSTRKNVYPTYWPSTIAMLALPGYRSRAMASALEEQLKTLPAKPGVYLFRDSKGDVLYVGKAKSLRPRVRSYFQTTPDSRAQIQSLPARVADIDVIVTGTEVEALHLEQNLVKRHRPPFNVRLRDDKSFPYIAVTVEDEYPRVMFTRERHRPGVWYFGPYANAKKVRETLDVLNRVFPYRPCEGPKPGRHSGIPCLDYHIDRCLAPCVGYVSKEGYRAIIDGVIEFLSGNVKT